MKCKRSSKRTTYGRGSWHSGFSNWTFLCWNLPVLFFALCAEAFLCWNLPVLFFALSSGFSNWTSLCWNLPVLFFALRADDLWKKSWFIGKTDENREFCWVLIGEKRRFSWSVKWSFSVPIQFRTPTTDPESLGPDIPLFFKGLIQCVYIYFKLQTHF